MSSSAPAIAEIYVLAGQSNMVGAGQFAHVSSELAKRVSSVPYWYTISSNARPEPRRSVAWAALGSVDGRHFGPEVGFADELLRAGRRAGIVKSAKGGTCLTRQWKPPNGPQYVELLDTVRKALAGLPTRRVAAFVWVQGECDAGRLPSAQAYAANLKSLVDGIRTAWHRPDLPIVIAELHPALTRDYRDVVAAEQRQFVEGDAHARLVQLRDLALKEEKIHYGDEMMLEAGRRLARAALSY